MDKSIVLALTTYGVGTIISFFVVLMIKGIFAALKFSQKITKK